MPHNASTRLAAPPRVGLSATTRKPPLKFGRGMWGKSVTGHAVYRYLRPGRLSPRPHHSSHTVFGAPTPRPACGSSVAARSLSDAGLSFVFVANALRCVFCSQLSCSAPSPAELGPHGLIYRGSCSVRAPLCACFRRPCPGRLPTRLLPRHLRHRAVPLGPARCWLQASIARRRAALPGPRHRDTSARPALAVSCSAAGAPALLSAVCASFRWSPASAR